MTTPTSTTELDDAYRLCRRRAARHGRTYYLATRLLPAPQRRAVHALYAFARTADDLVDTTGPTPTGDPAAELDRMEAQLLGRAEPTGPHRLVLLAAIDTITRYRIDADYFTAFLDSMRMDLPGSPLFCNRYPDMATLSRYMYGSAAVIGLQLLPVLGTVVPPAQAAGPAAALGEAFQLTNFLRDVAEDLDRDRVYLPADELAAFGVDEALLRRCRTTGRTDRRMRRALTHLIAVNRAGYRTADPGIDLLDPRVRPGIRTAARLYGEILDRIELSDYALFDRRVAVPKRRRAAVAIAEFAGGTAH
ncbi:phytoene/squalene synthase family protein [Skermania piniformis]|uniref:Phytoene/squalene synthase family protein n=1 Tax=Skermania pinensis TaxID=39122 RepID=A0ABX8SDT3_9ACTN|nr:phytoene/squalene synthase family protein [Skermania piniformis]QXQ15077.1 phytoene/squalene synthase family protein [Skermania piniformis]